MAHIAPAEAYEVLKDKVSRTIQDTFPVEGSQRTLKATRVWVDDTKSIDDIRGQKEAKLTGRDWTVPIRAELELYDNKSGKLLDRQTVNIAQLPKITRRYSYIVGGNDWQVANQFRLKSGVYTHIKANGELASQWNLAKGLGFHMNFDPTSRKFTLNYQGKGSNIPLYPVLKTLGVDDDTIERTWGKKVLDANKTDKTDPAIRKLYKAYTGSNPETLDEATSRIEHEFGLTELRPDSTKLTLGKPFETVNGGALLAGSDKILRVSRQEIPQDDRDSLEFKELWSSEDLLAHRLEKKHRWDLKRKLSNPLNTDKYTKVRQVIHPDIFGKPIKQFFTSSNLSDRPDQMNPISFLSGNRRTTLLGEGGITTGFQVTPEAKSINPSHMGFLDPIQTPECYDDKTEVFTFRGWKKWCDVSDSDLLACRVDGRLEFHKPERLIREKYKGRMYGLKAGKINYLVTPNHRVFHSTPWNPEDWKVTTAERIHGKERRFATAHSAWEPVDAPETFALPGVQKGGNAQKVFEDIPMEDWAEFMGWYLSKGSITYDECEDRGCNYVTHISQSVEVNPDCCAVIEALLYRLGWAANYNGEAFHVVGKQLAGYLKEFGLCNEKYIPEYFFKSNVESREALLESLLMRDGRVDNKRASGRSYKQRVFTTTSPRLAEGFERLAMSLGLSTSHKVYADLREDRYLDVHEVRVFQHPVRTARPKHPYYPANYYMEFYDGEVFCATVPGNLLYVRREGSVGFWSGNSSRIGATLQLSLGARKRDAQGRPLGKDLRVRVEETKTGKEKWITPGEALRSNLAFPDQYKIVKGKRVPVGKDVKISDTSGSVRSVNPGEVDYILKSSKGMFDLSANLIPFLQNDQGNRTMVAAKQAEQAIALSDREAPLVQVKSDSPHTFEKIIGNFIAHPAPTDGTVERVGGDAIYIRDKDGNRHEIQYYNDFPLNDDRSVLNSRPVVQKGDEVKRGQIVADNNYTKDGVLALGKNLNVAYMPWKGYNFEDGIVVSESAAKKLTSRHMQRIGYQSEKNTILNKKKFLAETAGSVTQAQADKLDDDGVIREGESVTKDDILVAALKEERITPEQRALGLFSKKLIRPVKPREKRWTKDEPGTVTKVVKHGKKTTVFVKYDSPVDIGDKIVGRHGNKGIVTSILPDYEMPVTKNGTQAEVLLNQTGIPSRINLGQVLETAAAKIAKKTGKPYIVNNFDPNNKDYTRNLINELKEHGLSDTEDMVDPVSGRSFGKVLIGPQYIYKLHHTAAKGITARSRDAYDSNMTPQGGGEHSGQTMDAMGLYAMLAHNARENVREMQTMKSDKNDEFWSMLQAGDSIPTPKVPFVWKKFEGYLKGMGIDIQKEGNDLILQPLTDKKTLAMSNGELRDPGRMFKGKNLEPEKGSIFDPIVTGNKWPLGELGNKWSHIRLAERMPNPVFEKPVQSLLNITRGDYDAVVDGTKELNGKTGMPAIVSALDNIDVAEEAQRLSEQVKTLRGSKLDKANKQYKYVRALKEAGLSAKEAYTIRYLPVLPPNMRPVGVTDRGQLMIDDINKLYSKIGASNKQLNTFPEELPPEGKEPLRKDLYDGLKALTLTGAIHQGRHSNSIADTIAGRGSPKVGFFQKRVIGRRQDLSMRGTIVPEPSLSLDEVAIPRKAATEIYKPFVVQRLVRQGFTPLDAQRQVEDKTPAARSALEVETQHRPILLKRDPVLHSYGVQAFRPRITEGKAIKIHPLATSGYNADFDGDRMSIIGDIILLETKEDVRHDADMKHTGKIIAHKVIDISQFPRVEESAKKSRSGSIEYDVPKDIFVPAFMEGKFHMMPVTKFHVHPGCEEWEVRTRDGRILRCSSDHSLTLLDPTTLEVVRARPDEAFGRCMPVLRNLHGGSLGDLQGDNRRGYRAMKDVVALTQDVGWFIGATIGDGWVRGARCDAVVLAHGKGGTEVQQQWLISSARLSKGACFEERTTPHEFDGCDCESVKTTIYSTALGCWLEPLIGRKAEFKHLPEHFMEMPLECRRGLFCGLIDTDGTVNWNARGQFTLAYNTSSRRLADEMILLGLSLGLHGKITTTRSPTSGKPHYVIPFSVRPVQDARWIKLAHTEKTSALEELQQRNSVDFGRNDFVPLPELVREELLVHLRDLGASKRPPNRHNDAFSQYTVLSRGDHVLSRTSVDRLKDLLKGRKRSDYLKKWFSLALDTGIGWDLVESSAPTGGLVEMYDLTVPDAWTFTMADGASVWDSAYVPVSPKAVREAMKMMPSSNLFSPSTGKLMFNPTQESMMGLYKLTEMGKSRGKKFTDIGSMARAVVNNEVDVNELVSLDDIKGDVLAKLGQRKKPVKTTAGRVMVYHALPEEIRDERILTDPTFRLDKDTLHNLLTRAAQSKDFAATADKLKNMGNEAATGLSIGLADFVADKTYRDKVLAVAKKQEADIRSRNLLPEERDQKLVEMYVKAADLIHSKGKEKADASDNRMYDWVKAKAKGNWDQFKQITIAPMMVSDSQGRMVPIPIDKSYSEGLDIGSYWASMHGARMGTIHKTEGTWRPGLMSKQVVQTTMNQMITGEDCGTNKGIPLSIDELDILGRYTARDVPLGRKGRDKGTVPAGTLITPDIINRLKNNKISKISVRSPLRCAHGVGLCSKCYGLGSDGELHQEGTNVGILAAMALGEPATQLSMRVFHEGGVVGAKGTSAGSVFSRLEQLTGLPDTLPGAATLATVDGRVSKIDKDPVGGWNVFVGEQKHYVPGRRALVVKRGQEVKRGESLSSGPKNPRQLLDLTSINAVQNYLTNEIQDVYKTEGPVRRRNTETFVRALTNLSEILDPGDHTSLLRGDKFPTSEIKDFNSKLPSGKKPILYKPILKGAQMLPLEMQQDWLARMQSTRLRQTVLDAAAERWRSQLHSVHPVPGMAYGKEFGSPPPGTDPWLY